MKDQFKVNFTDKEIQYYRDAFNLYDSNGTDTINKKELFVLMKTIGEPLNMNAIEQIFKDFDYNKSGELEFAEFLSFMSVIKKKVLTEKAVMDAFRSIDKDKNGKITLDEFIQAFETPSNTMNKLVIKFKEYDVNNDGSLSYSEFLRVMLS